MIIGFLFFYKVFKYKFKKKRNSWRNLKKKRKKIQTDQ